MASSGPIVKTVYKSKTSTTNCGYCKKPVKTENLKTHCVNVHKKPRLADGERSISSLFKSSGEGEKQSNSSEIEDTEVVEDNFQQMMRRERKGIFPRILKMILTIEQVVVTQVKEAAVK